MSRRIESQCNKAYRSGLDERKAHPFRNGSLHKIRQRWEEYQCEPENLINMGLHKVTKGKSNRPINHCMPSEMHWWVKRFPLQLCRVLGRDIVEAVPHLSSDGVSADTIKLIDDYLDCWVSPFLMNAEQARLYAKSDWPQTARELSEGYGQMFDLSVEFLRIVSFVLVEAEGDREWHSQSTQL